MTTLDKQDLLQKLAMLRAVLSGDIDPKDVGLDLKGTDGSNRRTLALAMVDAIGNEVHESLEKDRENKPAFGFAHYRKAA
jgi:hypothetical protein